MFDLSECSLMCLYVSSLALPQCPSCLTCSISQSRRPSNGVSIRRFKLLVDRKRFLTGQRLAGLQNLWRKVGRRDCRRRKNCRSAASGSKYVIVGSGVLVINDTTLSTVTFIQLIFLGPTPPKRAKVRTTIRLSQKLVHMP